MNEKNYEEEFELLERVDFLNEQVKTLATNLAVCLSKIKSKAPEIGRMEPDFVRLVNNTVKIVQEISVIIEVARNHDNQTSHIRAANINTDRLENKLEAILSQCGEIMEMMTVRTEEKIPE